MNKRILSFASSVVFAASIQVAHATQLLTNGGFETGDFTGWMATNNTTEGCETDWNVGNSGFATDCETLSDPIEGAFAAYNSFDGDGPVEFRLKQSFVVPNVVNYAKLSWYETYSIDNIGLPREFIVELTDATDTMSLGVINTQSFPAGFYEQDWTLFSVDVTELLSAYTGDTVTLSFTNVIPEEFTGPAGFGLDDVTLHVPEPASLAMLSFGLIGLGLSRKKKN